MQAKPAPVKPLRSVPGISDRGEEVKTELRVFAKSDFKHDFGEKIPSRDWITIKDRQRFSEMVQLFPVSQRVFMLNKFDQTFQVKEGEKPEKNGNNLYGLLKESIAAALYPEPDSKKEEFFHEEDILHRIGVDYAAIKGKFKEHFKKDATTGQPANADPFFIDLPIQGNLFTRNYRIGGQLYKNPDGTTRNLASLFKDVTGGKQNFAILVDASLGMSVSSIGDSTLTPDPGVPCTFAILQNIESDADSATGASSFKINTGGSNPMSVSILRDITTSTSLYPIWNNSNSDTQAKEAENLFTKINIILNRIKPGDIEASILLGEESHNIADVAKASNVKNASLSALIAIYSNELKGTAVSLAEKRKPFLYALLKRMGDWCQALSLLDRIRTYTVLDPQTKAVIDDSTYTIQELIEKNFEVGLVTNDRILLAYGILLGINVYFTTASDVNCLLYFKNMDDTKAYDDAAERTTNNVQIVQQVFNSFGVSSPEELLALSIGKYSFVIPDPTEGSPYDLFDKALLTTIGENMVANGAKNEELLLGVAMALKAKVALSNIGELRTNFNELVNEMIKSNEIVSSETANAKQKLDASINLVNIVNRIKIDNEYNDEVLNRLTSGRLSGAFDAQQNIFIDLTNRMTDGERMTISELMSRAKDVLLSIRDDISQILQKNIIPPEQLALFLPANPMINAEGRPNEQDIENFNTLYGAFIAVRTALPAGGQVGGKLKGGANDYSFLQREVFPYKTARLETTVKRLEEKAARNDAKAIEAIRFLNSLPAVQVGTYYRDEKNNPYSVIDRYVITKEDSNVLESLLETNGMEDFLVYRFALLYNDILYGRLENVFDQSDTVGKQSDDVEIEDGKVEIEDGKVDIEDGEVTEGATLEFERLVRESVALRYCVNLYTNSKSPDVVTVLLQMFRNGITEEDFASL